MPPPLRRIAKIALSLSLVLAWESVGARDTDGSDYRGEYRQGWAVYGDTARQHRLVRDFVRLHGEKGGTDTITVIASASPEGRARHLAPLARRRGAHLRTLLVNEGVSGNLIKSGRQDLDWEQLRDSVLTHPEVPGREQVLDLLGVPDISNAERISQLHKVDNGRAWKYLYKRFFPPMRYARASFPGMHTPVKHENVSITCRQPQLIPINPATILLAPKPGRVLPPRYWALKTNMVHDALLVPNIGLEWAFKRQWSISADYSGAWWGHKYRTKLWRYYGGNVDLKYYFGTKSMEKPLTGWHAGPYVELASYDFQLGNDGYQSKFSWGAGVLIGYMMPVSRHFNIDFALGLGYFGGKYKKCRYDKYGGYYHDEWIGTYKRHLWGPTRVEITLAWLIGRGNVNKGFKK